MTYDWIKRFDDGTSIELYEPIELQPSWSYDKQSGKRFLQFEGVVQVTFRGPASNNGTFFIRRFNFHRHWKMVEVPITLLAKLLGFSCYEYAPDFELDNEQIRIAVELMRKEFEACEYRLRREA